MYSPTDDGDDGDDARCRRSLRFLRLHRLPLLFGENVSETAELAGALEPLAAVHYDLMTVDVARLLANQERRQVSQLLVGSKTTERVPLLGQIFKRFHRHQTRERSFGRNGSRSDGIEAYPARSPFNSQASRQVEHAGLGHRRRHHISRAAFRVGGGDVEDRGTVALL